MYNPYLPSSPPPPGEQRTAPAVGKSGLGGLLKSLKLEELDTGDVLLLLILLFLFLDDRENNLELIIALGLALIL